MPGTFFVRNPFEEPVTITLGLVPHFPDWGLELSPDVMPNVQPGAEQSFILTVTPPGGAALPPDGTPIVDIEAFVGDKMLGGIRKIYRPPVPLHRLPDPIYAEREITVHPYPPRAGEPTEICAELRNITDQPQNVAVTFFWAKFGIGLPFTPIDGVRNVFCHRIAPSRNVFTGFHLWEGMFACRLRWTIAGAFTAIQPEEYRHQ